MTLEGPVWSVDPPIRLFVGIHRGERSGRLKAALLRCRGEGWGLRCGAVEAISMPAPADDALVDGLCGAIASLARRAQAPLAAIDCLGIGRLGEGGVMPPIASILAERTGITVVSGFAHRDRASNGRGGPLAPLPDWFLFRSMRTNRLLIHLGPSLRITWIAAGWSPSALTCFDVGPCNDFLDGLASELSQGRHPFDPSGHFAVQGRLRDDLLGKWSSHPYLLQSPPKFLDPSPFGADFRRASLSYARDRKLSARDVLCTANHFVVRNLTEALRRFLPGKPIDEFWVTGGGSWNGLLWKLLTEDLAPKPVARADAIGVPAEARGAIHAALLGYCAMENLCANLPHVSGAIGPRLLGQITPGSIENWDRWVCNLADRFELVGEKAA